MNIGICLNASAVRNSVTNVVVALVCGLLLSSHALAAPDKRNKVSGQEVAAMYSGKTWTWSKGGSFWSPDASFQAIWDGSVGLGKWYATTQGNLCYEAVWKDEPSAPGVQVKRCWLHVRDSDGKLWKQDSRTNEWYRAENEMLQRIKDGNSINSEVNALRRKLGM